MRYRGIIILVLGIFLMSPFFAGAQDFQKEDFYITPQLGINSFLK